MGPRPPPPAGAARPATSTTGATASGRPAGEGRPQDPSLRLGGVAAELQRDGEAVELALRQRVGAVLVERVLRGHDHERVGQRVPDAVDGHGALVHRLEERGLGARRGAVELVDEDDGREQRSGGERRRHPAGGSHIPLPVTSAGSRSAVAWIRRQSAPSARARARASVVLPVPGRSSSRMCPPARTAATTSSTRSRRSRTTVPMDCTRPRACARRPCRGGVRSLRGPRDRRILRPLRHPEIVGRMRGVLERPFDLTAARRAIRTRDVRTGRRPTGAASQVKVNGSRRGRAAVRVAGRPVGRGPGDAAVVTFTTLDRRGEVRSRDVFFSARRGEQLGAGAEDLDLLGDAVALCGVQVAGRRHRRDRRR